MLPVDLFTMIFSCFPEDLDREGDLTFRESLQRVAKFIVYDTQYVFFEWLFETRREVLQVLRAPSTPRGQVLPACVRQWLELVVTLAKSMAAFADHCRSLDTKPILCHQAENGFKRRM